MQNKDRIPLPKIFLACTPLLLILTACASGNANATPTLGLEAISTFAYLTFSVEMTTKLALTPPTGTPLPLPSPTPFPTLAPLSPLPPVAFNAPTLTSNNPTNCDDSEWIADVTIPDKTPLDPGKKFVKTWLIQNTGTCTWTTNYKLSFLDGLQMGGSDAYVPLPVPVNQQTQMSLNLNAPTSPGDYYGRWRMYNENKQPFGSILTVVIKVVPLEVPTSTP